MMAEEQKGSNTKAAFFLNLTFTVLEFIGGIISGSVAIVSDSLHDFADSVSLGLGWYFERKAEKGSNERYTYGYKRFSLLGAMINAIILLLGAVYIIYHSVQRILEPKMPKIEWMIGIAILGIALNGFAVWKMKSGKSLNQKVITIHLLEDTLGWIAVLIASIVMLFVDLPILDPILAIVITIAVLIVVVKKLVESLKIFLQRVPKGINTALLEQKILCLDGVEKVEHFHIWGLNEQKVVVSMHVKVHNLRSVAEQNDLKEKIKRIFNGIDTEHITIDMN